MAASQNCGSVDLVTLPRYFLNYSLEIKLETKETNGQTSSQSWLKQNLNPHSTNKMTHTPYGQSVGGGVGQSGPGIGDVVKEQGRLQLLHLTGNGQFALQNSETFSCHYRLEWFPPTMCSDLTFSPRSSSLSERRISATSMFIRSHSWKHTRM